MRWATITFVVSGSSFASLAERGIRAVIERGERIVKYQNFRLPRQRAGDGKALLLPAGDVPASCAIGWSAPSGYFPTNSAACDSESASLRASSVSGTVLSPKNTLSCTVPAKRTAFCVT